MVVIKSGANLLEHPELEGGDAVCLPACLPRSQGSVFWPPHSVSLSVAAAAAAFLDPPPFPPLNPLFLPPFLPAKAEKGHKVKAKGKKGRRG